MASVRKYDPERARQAAERVDANWAEIAERGTSKFLAGIDSDVPWNDRTVGDVYAARVAELVGADKRAKRLSETPRISALILMQPKIESGKDWERFAAEEAMAAERGRNAIDALHTEAVQCDPGAVGELPEELRGDFREEGSE